MNNDDINIYGKSGVATVHSEDKVLPNIWYAGYIDSEEHPLSIAVITENSVNEGISQEIAMNC